MKVSLERPKKRYWGSDWWGKLMQERDRNEWPIIRSLPFFFSPMMSRVHRVRAARARFDGKGIESICVHLWCGQNNFIYSTPKASEKYRKRNRLVEFPPQGEAVCGTCEGRAIGAGQLESRMIAGRMLLFTPQI